MAAMDCPVVPTPVASVPIDESDKRSYFQSLPPNSLIILDNDQTWREAFEAQLGSALSAVHVRNLDVNVCRIIYNMTKVSSKGVVQLVPPSRQSDQDLPHWVLSAMKCLANWPRPMKMINGEDSSLPNYPGFIRDVFDVVKDYFQGLGAPLIPFDLFDMFESAYVKAESVKSRHVVANLKFILLKNLGSGQVQKLADYCALQDPYFQARGLAFVIVHSSLFLL